MARMKYEIILAPEAAQDLKRLKAHTRSEVKDALERHLRHEPGRVSKSRIKRLRGVNHPQYRLRVGEIRVFCQEDGNNPPLWDANIPPLI
jgi:mRNA-degrading endonuclease RelE of RelBE toxin-antitoxin system